MSTIVYQGIIAATVFFIIWEMLEEKDIKIQFTAAMALIPLLLRLFKIA